MKSDKQDKWYAVSVTVTPDYVPAAEAAFNELPSLGSEVDLLTQKSSDLCTVTAYFNESQDEDAVAEAMKTSAEIHDLAPDVDFVVRQDVIERQDWLAEWKKYWKPTMVGRFVIAAPWHEVPDDDSKFVVRIEPNMAFGTGTHETTKLCLEAIDRYFTADQSFLDVGTGTGILAIAAAMIGKGERQIYGLDNDPDAVEISGVNAEANGVGEMIRFSTGTLTTKMPRCDLVCANLTADVIVSILPMLLDKTNRTLVLSGILAEQEKMVLEAMAPRRPREVNRAGEWIAVIVERN